MSRTPCRSSFFGIGSMPHSGMPGPPDRAGIAQDHDMIRRNVEVGIVHRFVHLVVAVEHERRPGMLQQARLGGRRLDHASVGSEIAVKDRGAA